MYPNPVILKMLELFQKTLLFNESYISMNVIRMFEKICNILKISFHLIARLI